MRPTKNMGVILSGVAGAVAASGCGLPSTTLALNLAAQGSLPAGLSSARFTVSEIDVAIDTKDHGQVWVNLIDEVDGARTFDLAQLTQGQVLASERDLPGGAVEEVDVLFQSQSAPSSGTLQFAPDAATELKFAVGGIQTTELSLVIDFDVASSLQAQSNGAWAFAPVARLEESP